MGALQGLVNAASAAQDVAITRLACIEGEWAEDGTVLEVHKAPGHVALDAPAIVSGVLSVSAVHAERRVREAVRRVADGPEGTATSTGLGGLHAAMAAGVLDAYRAQVVAFELEEVPADVASAVLETIGSWFEVEDAAHLRRRVRRVLARVSPDLLRRRAVRARSQCRLERWVDEPGVDTWHGTFPSEEACAAWAAIDALAQRYVTDGVCRAGRPGPGQGVDRPRHRPRHHRGPAHPDHPRQHARRDRHQHRGDGDQQVDDSGCVGDRPRPGPRGPCRGAGPGQRGWLDTATSRGTLGAAPAVGTAHGLPRLGGVAPARGASATLECDPVTGALVDPDHRLGTDSYRPGRALTALVRARDGRCRFPGCTVAARFCDLDHVTPWPAGPTTASNLACLCRRHHRVKQRPGWTVRIAADATMTWTDPTGATRTTHPLDHRPLTLPDTATDTPPPTPGTPSLAHPDGPHSTLEYTLEHHLGPPRPRPPCRVETRHPTSRPVDRIPVHLDPHPGRRQRPTPTRPADTPPF